MTARNRATCTLAPIIKPKKSHLLEKRELFLFPNDLPTAITKGYENKVKTYLDLLEHVKRDGVYRDDRTGTGTWSVFGAQARFSLEDGFPLLTTKKLHLRSIIHELLWFLKGETNLQYLHENKVSIWD